MTYPKWIQFAPHLGPLLATNEAEEKELNEWWAARSIPKEEKPAESSVTDKPKRGRPRKTSE